MCRSFLDNGLLQLSYFCGAILSNVMLEWSDDRELLSHSKQYMLHRLVGIVSLTLGHSCKLTIVGFEYPSVTKSSLGWPFYHGFFQNIRKGWANFISTVTLKIRKLLLQAHVQVNLNVVSRKVRKFCLHVNIFQIVRVHLSDLTSWEELEWSNWRKIRERRVGKWSKIKTSRCKIFCTQKSQV